MEKIVVNKNASEKRIDNAVKQVYEQAKTNAENGISTVNINLQFADLGEQISVTERLEKEYGICVCHKGMHYLGTSSQSQLKEFDVRFFIKD